MEWSSAADVEALSFGRHPIPGTGDPHAYALGYFMVPSDMLDAAAVRIDVATASGLGPRAMLYVPFPPATDRVEIPPVNQLVSAGMTLADVSCTARGVIEGAYLSTRTIHGGN